MPPWGIFSDMKRAFPAACALAMVACATGVTDLSSTEGATGVITPLLGTPMGNTDTITNGWNDSQGIGGEDNSIWLSIEVVHVSGNQCGPGFEWTLTITGNT